MVLVLPLDEGLERAAALVRQGGVVAFPTDTVYGVGGDARRAEVLDRLFRLKGRDRAKALAVLLADAHLLGEVCANPPEAATRMAARFFPGALTLVVPLSADFPCALHAGRGTIGVRVPDHAGARRLLAACGGLLAVTSANRSGERPAETPDEVVDALGEDVDVILDGGRAPGGVPSTVVDTTAVPPTILRFGAIAAERLAPYLRAGATP
jgi:L-threonylcarbamoyladenylate synthase